MLLHRVRKLGKQRMPQTSKRSIFLIGHVAVALLVGCGGQSAGKGGAGDSVNPEVEMLAGGTAGASGAGADVSQTHAMAGGGASAAGDSQATASGGGATGIVAAPSCGNSIDDMEDGDLWICNGSGRIGRWYLYRGISEQQDGPPGIPANPARLDVPRGESRWAMRASWDEPENGALLGVDLAFDGTSYGLYDASAFSGIRFWAKIDAGAAPSRLSIGVNISTASNTWTGYGGTVPQARNAYGDVPEYVELSRDWQLFEVSLARAFELDKLVNIQFRRVDENSDFWIDDLEFIPRDAP